MAGLPPSGGPPLAEISGEQVELLFGLWSQVVRAGTLYRGAETAEVYMIVAPLELELTNGVTILPGDERVLIRGSDLVGVAEPRAGDYVVETVSGLRRDVAAVQVDSARQLWTLIARKSLV